MDQRESRPKAPEVLRRCPQGSTGMDSHAALPRSRGHQFAACLLSQMALFASAAEHLAMSAFGQCPNVWTWRISE
jgi:hypothetical protein